MAKEKLPKELETALKYAKETDPKQRLEKCDDIMKYFNEHLPDLPRYEVLMFVEPLNQWIKSSNFKCAQTGMELMCQIVDRLGREFREMIHDVLPACSDRMGDNRESVRQQAQIILMRFIEKEAISSPAMISQMQLYFVSKNANCRCESITMLRNIMARSGMKFIVPGEIIPALVKLLGDQNSNVRDNALLALGVMYTHLGDPFRIDLVKKYDIPSIRLIGLNNKFDEIKETGDFKPTAVIGTGLPPIPHSGLFDESDLYSNASDETDRQGLSNETPVQGKKRSVSQIPSSGMHSASSVRRSSSVKPAGTATPAMQTRPALVSRSSSLKRPPSAAAGAVDEEFFLKAFEEKTEIQIFSAKEVDDHMIKIRECIANANADWNKRVEAMKKLRSLLIAGAGNFEEFYSQLRLLEVPFQTAVKDLRSQVVREACITVAFLSTELQNKFEHFAECLLQSLINLLMNSAKVVASSGIVCVRIILQNIQSHRLVPVIVSQFSSKSKDIRRAACEFLDLIVHTWSTHTLERHIALLQEGIKKGMTDADPDARQSARKAYWGFKEHFPDQAESLIKNLDPSYKRALSSEGGAMSASNSSNSLNRAVTPRLYRQSPSPSEGGSVTTPRRVPAPTTSLRSNSAIDLQAAQRAKARAQYAALARQKVGSGASLPRSRKPIPDSGPGSLGAGPERVGRTRNRVSGVSQSQPSSRSGSPSSRLNYTTYTGQYSSIDGPNSLALGRPRRSSTSTPRSTGASRETSPNRYTGIHTFGSKIRSRGMVDRPPIQPSQSRPVMAQKILQQSLEAESALAEALNLEPTDNLEGGVNRTISSRKSSCRPFEDHSDDSETSSVCSERSFDSFRRPSDSYSWSGSQQRLYRDIWEPTAKDINEIIANCESTHWSDRKEGLVGLQAYLQAGNILQASELKRVTENFTKMFMDSHTKVFSLFLDTLNDLIVTHRTDLNFWLYVLLTRLLNKLGGDLLGSIQNKIHKSLDVVRASFPSDVQMSTVLRFLCDATQTPNARVKTAACNYITKLAAVTDPGLAFLPPSPGQVKDTATAALTKMIGWTMGDSIKQGSELRRAAQEAIIALFNLNTPQVTLRFSHLPKEYQEAAANLIQGRVRRSSASSSGGIIGGGGSGGSPPPMSPGSPSPITAPAIPNTLPPTSPSKYPSHIDAENLNPEEVYRSLRRTTAEIQNYSYESGGKKIDREETSQDSGISQMSSGGDPCGPRSLTQHMEDLSISRTQSNRSSSTGRVLTVRDCNGIDTTDNNQSEGFNIGAQTTTGNIDESEAMRKVVESLKSPVEGDDSNNQNCLLTDQEKKIALNQLIRLIRESSCVAIMDHFKSLLRVLLTQLGSNEPTIRSLVLASLTEMMKKRALAESFNNYVELLVLKVLQAFKDGTKEVQRSAEICAATIASLLAPELVIRVLVPLITTGDYPVNLGAIKTLTKLVETRGRDPVQNYLSDLMPGLIQAYDNEESSVRKSAVFCMVALHTSVGEEQLRPHLSSLNGSKLKLLHLYIKRAQQGSSVPTSPKNQPTAS